MKKIFSLSETFFLFLVLLGLSCSSNNSGKIPKKTIEEGRILATQYCQSCHLLPDPQWVDAKTWETGVMPAMGPKMGIFDFKGKRYQSNKYDFSLPSDFYPAKPMLNDEQWQKIMDFYHLILFFK